MTRHDRAGLTAHPQTIPFDEWWRLWHFVSAIDARDTGMHRLWLEVSGGRRVWHISSVRFHFEFVALRSGAEGSFSVPIESRMVHAATDAIKSDADAVLSLIEDSLVLSCDDVELDSDVPQSVPGGVIELGSIECTAIVPTGRLADCLDAARTAPIGFEFDGYGPPLWCVIEDGRVAFHSDWTSYGHGRATVKINATTTGEARFHSAVSIVSRILRDFIGSDLESDTVEIQVDRPDGNGCRVVGADWTLTCPFIDPVAVEWTGSMRRELSNAGFDVKRDGDRAVEFMVGRVQVRAQVHGGRHPVCRLSATVARGIDTSDFLLRELNEWNMSHAGLKFWWENEKVVAVIDVACSNMGDIGSESSRLASIVEMLAPATAAL